MDGEIQEHLDPEDAESLRIDALKRVTRLERVLVLSADDVRKMKKELINTQVIGKRQCAEDEPLLTPNESPMKQSSWAPPPGFSPSGWVPYIVWDPNLVNSQSRWVPSREAVQGSEMSSMGFQGRVPVRELPHQVNGPMTYPPMGFPFGHETNGFR